MNFDTKASPWKLPELGWRFGNLFELILMAATVTVMFWYFWRNNWISFAWLTRKKR
jgi:magnesium transporter